MFPKANTLENSENSGLEVLKRETLILAYDKKKNVILYLMKQSKKNSQSIRFRVNKSLDKYADRILFPEKLAKANKLLKGVKIP